MSMTYSLFSSLSSTPPLFIPSLPSSLFPLHIHTHVSCSIPSSSPSPCPSPFSPFPVYSIPTTPVPPPVVSLSGGCGDVLCVWCCPHALREPGTCCGGVGGNTEVHTRGVEKGAGHGPDTLGRA